jgi:hypothetical protein
MWITKEEVLEAASRREGPLGKVADDEPIFVLRAQDCLSDELVDKWADDAIGAFSSIDDPEKAAKLAQKVADARQDAEAMRNWPTRKRPD